MQAPTLASKKHRQDASPEDMPNPKRHKSSDEKSDKLAFDARESKRPGKEEKITQMQPAQELDVKDPTFIEACRDGYLIFIREPPKTLTSHELETGLLEAIAASRYEAVAILIKYAEAPIGTGAALAGLDRNKNMVAFLCERAECADLARQYRENASLGQELADIADATNIDDLVGDAFGHRCRVKNQDHWGGDITHVLDAVRFRCATNEAMLAFLCAQAMRHPNLGAMMDAPRSLFVDSDHKMKVKKVLLCYAFRYSIFDAARHFWISASVLEDFTGLLHYQVTERQVLFVIEMLVESHKAVNFEWAKIVMPLAAAYIGYWTSKTSKDFKKQIKAKAQTIFIHLLSSLDSNQTCWRLLVWACHKYEFRRLILTYAKTAVSVRRGFMATAPTDFIANHDLRPRLARFMLSSANFDITKQAMIQRTNRPKAAYVALLFRSKSFYFKMASPEMKEAVHRRARPQLYLLNTPIVIIPPDLSSETPEELANRFLHTAYTEMLAADEEISADVVKLTLEYIIGFDYE